MQSQNASTGSTQHLTPPTLDPASSKIVEKTPDDGDGLAHTPVSEEVMNEATCASDGGSGNELQAAIEEEVKESDLQVQEEVVSVVQCAQETSDQTEVDAGPYFQAPRPLRRVSLLEYKERMKEKKKVSTEEYQRGENAKELPQNVPQAVEEGEDLEDPLAVTQNVQLVAATTPPTKDKDVPASQPQSNVDCEKVAKKSKEVPEQQTSATPPSDPPASDDATMKQATIEWPTTTSSGRGATDGCYQKRENRDAEVSKVKLPKRNVQVEGAQPALERREKMGEKKVENQDKERQNKDKERARIEELEREWRRKREEEKQARKATKTPDYNELLLKHTQSPGQPRFTIPVHHGPRYNRPPSSFPLPRPRPPLQPFVGFPHAPYHQAPPVPFAPPPPHPPPPAQTDVWSMFGSLFAQHNLFPSEDPPPPPPRSPSPPLPPLQYSSPRILSPTRHSSPSHQVLPPARLSSPPPSSSTSLSPRRKSHSPEPSPFHPQTQSGPSSPVSKVATVEPKPSQLDAKQFRIISELIKKTTVIKTDVSVQTLPPRLVSEGTQSGSGFQLLSTALQVNVKTCETSTGANSHLEVQHRLYSIMYCVSCMFTEWFNPLQVCADKCNSHTQHSYSSSTKNAKRSSAD